MTWPCSLPVLVTVGGVLLTGCAPGVRNAQPVHSPMPIGDAWYLPECARCGARLGARGETIDRVDHARDVRFCSAECAAIFDRDPATAWDRADRAMIADQAPHYPLGTSIVSGRPLGEEPLDFIIGNRHFRVTNAAERADVARDPARYLRAPDRAAIRAQAPGYAMPDKCPVQGDILASDTPIDLVVANRMVRVCCGRCARVVRLRPSQYLGMVDHANRRAHSGEDAISVIGGAPASGESGPRRPAP